MYKDIVKLENEVINATRCVCGKRMSYRGKNNGYYVFACKNCEKGKLLDIKLNLENVVSFEKDEYEQTLLSTKKQINNWNDPTITLDDLQSELVYHYNKAIEDGNEALVNSLEKILDEFEEI
ncbi:MAG TPA: zinc ribbon domain-containing protein [Bacteroidales bacterium]|nr:zinc ribbon domain-containing protein [Bacteroidales bacterium]